MTPGISAEQSSSLFNIYCSLRDRSLRILSAKMQTELQSSQPMVAKSTNSISATEILASMLALCYTEVFVPGSLDWKVHLRACRTIINFRQLEVWQGTCTDPVLKFLVKDINDLEILTSTTAFDDDVLSLSALSLQYNNTVSGWAFTSLIHKITTLERRRHFAKLSKKALRPVNMSALAYWCEESHAALTPKSDQQKVTNSDAQPSSATLDMVQTPVVANPQCFWRLI
ncbi:hypothetical protein E4U55_002384 [Claviceps digitariae]|nr:hypothetical protein E4U55_002384 [Claviceps digitariae]